ncbi:MAG: hypothetical protein OXC40_00365, partial [Proteobacteria bacterium]|nr:hypothetical protein [Pseudomonadota bacterium]
MIITKTHYQCSAIVMIFVMLILSDWQILEAATVKRKLPKRSVIVIDEGKRAGVNVGDQVCFFDGSENEIGCGEVRRIMPNRSFVKVKRPILKKVRKGFIATYGSAAELSSSNNSGQQPANTGSKIIGLRLFANTALYPPYHMRDPEYVDAKKDPNEGYWQSDKENLPSQYKF